MPAPTYDYRVDWLGRDQLAQLIAAGSSVPPVVVLRMAFSTQCQQVLDGVVVLRAIDVMDDEVAEAVLCGRAGQNRWFPTALMTMSHLAHVLATIPVSPLSLNEDGDFASAYV